MYDDVMRPIDKKYIVLSSHTKLTFGMAFDMLRGLQAVTQSTYGMRLPHWSDDVIIKIQTPDEHSKMTAPYLYVESRFGRVPWKETMIELFSNEWCIVQITEEDEK